MFANHELANGLMKTQESIYMTGVYSISTLNRFVSADTIVPDPTSPQNFNRYAYALNNPVKFRDPTGHATCQSLDSSCYAEETTPVTLNDYEDALLNQLKGENHPDQLLLKPSNSPNLVTDANYSVWRKMGMCSKCHVTHFNGGYVPTNEEIDESTVDFYRVHDEYKTPVFLGAMNIVAANASLAIEFTESPYVLHEPENLAEALTLDEAQAGAGARIMKGEIRDPMYPEDIWVKMQHTHVNPDGEKIVIHCWKNLLTGEAHGFKFK